MLYVHLSEKHTSIGCTDGSWTLGCLDPPTEKDNYPLRVTPTKRTNCWRIARHLHACPSSLMSLGLGRDNLVALAVAESTFSTGRGTSIFSSRRWYTARPC